jgi:hypothetical protein
VKTNSFYLGKMKWEIENKILIVIVIIYSSSGERPGPQTVEGLGLTQGYTPDFIDPF